MSPEGARTIPGFERDAACRPVIGRDPLSIARYGHLIRRTEETLLDLFSLGQVGGTTHTCIGQELCQMSVVRALGNGEDAVFSNHRNHGHFLTYSGDFFGLLAEIQGKVSGVVGGRGGSQHLAWHRFLSNGVQAGLTGCAVGNALARKWKKDDAIAAVFIGDGTLGEGLLYEALNLASLWRVPALFVVENNRIAQTTPTEHGVAGDILDRGIAFGLDALRVNDRSPDFLAEVEGFVGRVRSTGRAGFLVIDTERLGPHSKGDDRRAAAELEALRRDDPLARIIASLPEETWNQARAENEAYIDALRAATALEPDAVPLPEAGRLSDAGPLVRLPSAYRSPEGTRTVREQLNRSLADLLENDPRSVLLGEDLHDPYGGAFKVSAGLSTRFPERVISTPISEAGITGAGIGLGLAGYRPIVEIMFGDFLTLCVDQLCNHALKFNHLGEHLSVPLVVRTPVGGRRGYGPTHSQNLEGILSAVPGLVVVFPSHRHDAGALLHRAVASCAQPVLFLEHKLLYGRQAEAGAYETVAAEDAGPLEALFPTLARRRPSADIAIIAFGGMVPVVEEAAAWLEENEELEITLIVPSLLAPFPHATIAEQVARCAAVLVAEEGHDAHGVSSEILAGLAERDYGSRGRLARIGTPASPIPAARGLEDRFIPDSGAVIAAVRQLIQGCPA